jgi:hypothetical protein
MPGDADFFGDCILNNDIATDNAQYSWLFLVSMKPNVWQSSMSIYNAEREVHIMNGFVGFVLIVLGVITVASPYAAWYLSIGWKFKDAEPSEAALFMHRLGGVIATIVGLVLLVSSCVSMFSNPGESWKKEFLQRVEAGEVSDITFGWGAGKVTLTADEREEVLGYIEEADWISFEPESMYGYSGSGEITFVDGDQAELIITAPYGSVELHPRRSKYAYRLESSLLRIWIQEHVD